MSNFQSVHIPGGDYRHRKMSAAVGGAAGQAPIAAFLHFFDVKRDLYVAEVEHVVTDLKEARLYDDMYTKDDVEEIFGDLVTAVKERVRKDLEASASMAALALQQVLTAAEDAGASGDALAVDMTSVEDEAALARIRSIGAAGSAAAAVADASEARRKNVVKLDSLRDEQQRLLAENVKLTEEAAALRERYMAMQMQASSLTTQKADLAARVEALGAELAALKTGATAAAAVSASHEAELATLRQTVADLHAQAEVAKTGQLAAEKEREASVNLSKPFQMMKTLLARKNAQLADLRGKLKRYEPDDDDD